MGKDRGAKISKLKIVNRIIRFVSFHLQIHLCPHSRYALSIFLSSPRFLVHLSIIQTKFIPPLPPLLVPLLPSSPHLPPSSSYLLSLSRTFLLLQLHLPQCSTSYVARTNASNPQKPLPQLQILLSQLIIPLLQEPQNINQTLFEIAITSEPPPRLPSPQVPPLFAEPIPDPPLVQSKNLQTRRT